MKSNKIFKKHFWKFFIIDFAFLFVLFCFVIFSKLKIKKYFATIENYTSQISGLHASLQQQSAEAVTNLETLLLQMEPLVDKLALFALVIVPITIFAIWVFSQAMNFSLIEKDKWLSLRGLLVFAIYTLPLFLIFILLGNQLITLLYQRLLAIMISWQFYFYFILLIILFYLGQVFYSLSFRKQSLEFLKSTISTAFIKFSKMFIYYLPHITCWFIVFLIFLSSFIKYTAGNFTGLAFNIIPLAFFLILLSLSRIFFYKKVQEKF